VHLADDSHGGAVALRLAAANPTRVRGVVVYEPVLLRLPFDCNARRAPAQDTLDRARIAQLRMPILFLTGAKTIGATRRIGELLRYALPYAHHDMLPGMGHLGPVTHAPVVNARIAGFMDAEIALQAALAPLREAA
jgi:pimeloyl-ACP methyl ester carboxylesterase